MTWIHLDDCNLGPFLLIAFSIYTLLGKQQESISMKPFKYVHYVNNFKTFFLLSVLFLHYLSAFFPFIITVSSFFFFFLNILLGNCFLFLFFSFFFNILYLIFFSVQRFRGPADLRSVRRQNLWITPGWRKWIKSKAKQPWANPTLFQIFAGYFWIELRLDFFPFGIPLFWIVTYNLLLDSITIPPSLRLKVPT